MVQEGQKREREEMEEPGTTTRKLEAIPEEDLEEELVGPVLPEPKKRRVQSLPVLMLARSCPLASSF